MDYTLGDRKFNVSFLQKVLQSRAFLCFVVLLLVLKIIFISISINLPRNIFFADITRIALQNFVNETRQAIGLTQLVENRKLNEVAELKAQNMIQEQYFNHTSPSGVTPWHWFSEAGYNYKYAGENLAIGFYDSKEVFNAWMDSPSHKANILNPNYKEVGTAVLSGFGPNNAIIVVQEFGSRLSTKTTKNVQVQAQVQVEKPVEKIVPDSETKTPQVVNPSVLSEQTKSQNASNNLSSKLMNFAIYNYETLLQDIIYGASFIAIGILLIIIFFGFNVEFNREFVFRSVLIIVLLSLATLINREVVVSTIPHQIII